MPDRLPPLTALRAFEAAARHLSIKQAAVELHVTAAAVGYQVKALEKHLGCRLFHRLNRGLRLTDAGQACLPELEAGFAMLSQAASRARRQASNRSLVVSVAPVLAVKWLVPRLDRFLEAHPETELRLDTTGRLVDLNSEADVAIRFASREMPGLDSDLLFRESVSPVCSPTLLESPHALREPRDLAAHTLIHLHGVTQDKSWPDWPAWLAAADAAGIDGRPGPRFNQVGTAIEAAAQKQGVTLVGHVCVADELNAGRLVRPFDDTYSVETSFAYYVVSSESRICCDEAQAFRAWVIDEAENDPTRRIMRM